MLVADDEPALRGALADLLAHEDRVSFVGAAADADEAIALAARERPDVALVDVKMPAGGGPRAAREIQRLSPATRVIALSAFEDRPTVLEMLRAGAVGYLVKGTPTEDIMGSIRRVAEGKERAPGIDCRAGVRPHRFDLIGPEPQTSHAATSIVWRHCGLAYEPGVIPVML